MPAGGRLLHEGRLGALVRVGDTVQLKGLSKLLVVRSITLDGKHAIVEFLRGGAAQHALVRVSELVKCPG